MTKKSLTVNLNGIKNIILGFVFVMLDIDLFGFDFLPDFIGIAIICLGLYKMQACDSIAKANKIATVYLFVSLADFILSVILRFVSVENMNWFTIPSKIICVFFEIILVYFLLKGLTEICRNSDRNDLASNCNTAFFLFLFLQLISNFAVYFFDTASVLGVVLVLLLMLTKLFSYVVLIFILKQVYDHLPD